MSSLYLIMETKTCTSTVVCIDSSDFLPVKRSFCGTQNPQEFHFSRYSPPKKYFYIFQITLVLFKLKHRFLTDERHSSVGLICLRWTCTMYSTAPVDSNSVCSTYVSTFEPDLCHLPIKLHLFSFNLSLPLFNSNCNLFLVLPF